jgi:hypothetical protein
LRAKRGQWKIVLFFSWQKICFMLYS